MFNQNKCPDCNFESVYQSTLEEHMNARNHGNRKHDYNEERKTESSDLSIFGGIISSGIDISTDNSFSNDYSSQSSSDSSSDFSGGGGDFGGGGGGGDW